MGGFGSGNRRRLNKKRTVDESLTLAVRDFRGHIYPHSSGEFTWTWTLGNTSSIGYRVSWENGPTITLQYVWRDGEEIELPIRLQTTSMKFGGERWWFSCPTFIRGKACDRRVAKIHLPHGSRYFGCRSCHDLTYRSSQEAHRSERFGGGGCDAQIRRLLARLGRTE